MRKWILKAIIQKGISFFPFKHKVNYLFQRYITKKVILSEEHFLQKLDSLKQHNKCFHDYINESNNYTVLEIGTGWYPVVPIGLFLSGATKIYTIDLTNLLTAANIITTARKFIEYHNAGQLQKYIQSYSKERIKVILDLAESTKNLKELLTLLNIEYYIADAGDMGFLKNESIKQIVSNNTLEHIYSSRLLEIFTEFKRVLYPKGIMSHLIDLSDHFSHLDQSITNYNFLKFSEKEWSIIDNSIQPQNRLRITDYRNLFKEVGFNILKEKNRKGTLEELQSIKINSKYEDIPVDDLLITHSWMVAAK